MKNYEPVHYPPLAVQTHIAGTVKLRIVVDWAGDVTDASVVSGHPLLVREAVNNIQKWKFQPLEAGSIEFELNYDFALRDTPENERDECVSFGLPQHILVLVSPSIPQPNYAASHGSQ